MATSFSVIECSVPMFFPLKLQFYGKLGTLNVSGGIDYANLLAVAYF